MTWGADDRVGLIDADFTAVPILRAIGRLDTTGICTATHIGNNLLLTARHCVSDAIDPTTIVFRPAYTGLDTTTNRAARPSIRARRVIRGTGDDGKFNSNPPGTYFPGSDWALIEVDPATYQRGAGGPNIPLFPTTWSGWPAIGMSSLPNPIISPINVAAIGYSGDFYPVFNAPGVHRSCQARRDGVCNAANASEGDGIVLTSCESNPGASGGPVVIGYPTAPQIVSVIAGNGVSAPQYNDDIANKLVNINGINTAPRRAAGFTFTRMGNGVTLAVASDSSSAGQVRWNNFDSADGFHPRHPWRPWGDSPSSTRTFGRMASTLTPDNHAFIFSLVGNGILSRWETAPGAWSGWADFFPAASMGINTLDIDAASSGNIALQVYTLHNDGQLRTRRKVGAWNSAWDNEVDLGVVGSGRAIAASNIESYQVLFVIRPDHAYTRWETQPQSNQWTDWYFFSDGLPTGLQLIDIAAGHDASGRLDVYLLAHTPWGTREVFRRTKTTASAGSAWGSWASYLTVPKETTQIEVGPVHNGVPRLAFVRDGELLVRRHGSFNIESGDPDFVVPAYAAEPTPVAMCPSP